MFMRKLIGGIVLSCVLVGGVAMVGCQNGGQIESAGQHVDGTLSATGTAAQLQAFLNAWPQTNRQLGRPDPTMNFGPTTIRYLLSTITVTWVAPAGGNPGTLTVAYSRVPQSAINDYTAGLIAAGLTIGGGNANCACDVDAGDCHSTTTDSSAPSDEDSFLEALLDDYTSGDLCAVTNSCNAL
jgi:hypothetical protein